MKTGAWLLGLLLVASGAARAQWDLEDSHTTADLRGIDNVGAGVAWASGTDGTVLRTQDGGYLWQACSIPPGAEHLDFRGIQAFDANTAIVMSSGKGDLSRLYKTTDGCQTWKLVFTNPDKDGFWDAITMTSPNIGMLIGDPVVIGASLGSSDQMPVFPTYHTIDGGANWRRNDGGILYADADGEMKPREVLFAASNSSMLLIPNAMLFVTGGEVSGLHIKQYWRGPRPTYVPRRDLVDSTLARGETAGGFSIAANYSLSGHSVTVESLIRMRQIVTPESLAIVVVGGDFRLPNEANGTAASCNFKMEAEDMTFHCVGSATTPHGYRSAVAYDAASKTWITVGPNGTDASTDDGRNWRALHPDTAVHEAPDADRDWNALSLPFVVGPHGRIGKLRASALASPPH